MIRDGTSIALSTVAQSLQQLEVRGLVTSERREDSWHRYGPLEYAVLTTWSPHEPAA